MRKLTLMERYTYCNQDSKILEASNIYSYDDLTHFQHSIRLIRDLHQKLANDVIISTLIKNKTINYPITCFYMGMIIDCIKRHPGTTIRIQPQKNNCIHDNNSQCENINYDVVIYDYNVSGKIINLTEKNYDEIVNLISIWSQPIGK